MEKLTGSLIEVTLGMILFVLIVHLFWVLGIIPDMDQQRSKETTMNVNSYHCPHCGAQLPAEEVNKWMVFNCPSCGHVVEPSIFKCPSCSNSLRVIHQRRQLMRYCETCGYYELRQGLSEIQKSNAESTPDISISPYVGQTKYCNTCGAETSVSAKFCPMCGTSL